MTHKLLLTLGGCGAIVGVLVAWLGTSQSNFGVLVVGVLILAGSAFAFWRGVTSA